LLFGLAEREFDCVSGIIYNSICGIGYLSHLRVGWLRACGRRRRNVLKAREKKSGAECERAEPFSVFSTCPILKPINKIRRVGKNTFQFLQAALQLTCDFYSPHYRWQAALVLSGFLILSVCGKEIKLRSFIKVGWEFFTAQRLELDQLII